MSRGSFALLARSKPMATQPNIPSPDTIEPAAPPEAPVTPSPNEAPGEPARPDEFETPTPDYDNPDPVLPETPMPPD
jgi:hypothetical protein